MATPEGNPKGSRSRVLHARSEPPHPVVTAARARSRSALHDATGSTLRRRLALVARDRRCDRRCSLHGHRWTVGVHPQSAARAHKGPSPSDRVAGERRAAANAGRAVAAARRATRRATDAAAAAKAEGTAVNQRGLGCRATGVSPPSRKLPSSVSSSRAQSLSSSAARPSLQQAASTRQCLTSRRQPAISRRASRARGSLTPRLSAVGAATDRTLATRH